jgi:hypothetical protein
MDHLHQQSVAALDATYADLLQLARQGAPGAKAQLRDLIALRARLTGDTQYQAQQQREVDQLPTG